MQIKSAVSVKKLHFFSLVCYARLLSVGRLVLLRNVYLHAVGIKRALAHYTAAGKKFIYHLSSIIYNLCIYPAGREPPFEGSL